MYLPHALTYTGLVAAVVLLVASPKRALAIVAVLAAALEVLALLGLLWLKVAGVPLSLVLGLALAVPALVIWFGSTTKAAITAAALTAFVGILQVVAYAVPRV
jgi:hypothetical protein